MRLVEKSKAFCGIIDFDAHASRGLSPEGDKENRSRAPTDKKSGNGASPASVNAAVKMESKVNVFIRKRPLNAREYAIDAVDCVSVGCPTGLSGGRDAPDAGGKRSERTPKSMVIMHEPKVRVDLRREVEQHRFDFDGAFSANQDSSLVYSSCVSPVVRAAMSACASRGENRRMRSGGTVFAYGQTGSGKTYTMQRMLKSAVEEVFQLLGGPAQRGPNGDKAPLVKVSCYEIYSGKVFDLLGGPPNNNNNINNNAAFAVAKRNNNLQVREDARGNVVVVGLSQHDCLDAASVLALARRAEAMRATGSTAANDLSSRSHYVFQMDVTLPGRACKLRLVDLAGSERGADTNCSDRRTRQEGAEINKSLLALKECIRALDSDNGGHPMSNVAGDNAPNYNDNHVPFRGCRLTHLLRDAFVGSGCTNGSAVTNKLAVLACIAPGSDSVEHSLNTLRYAAHIKEFGRGDVGGHGAADGDDITCGKIVGINNVQSSEKRIVKLNRADLIVRADVPHGYTEEQSDGQKPVIEDASAAPSPDDDASGGSPNSSSSSPSADRNGAHPVEIDIEEAIGGDECSPSSSDGCVDEELQRRRLQELCEIQKKEVDALHAAMSNAQELLRRMHDWQGGDAAGHLRVIEALKLRMMQQRDDLLRQGHAMQEETRNV